MFSVVAQVFKALLPSTVLTELQKDQAAGDQPRSLPLFSLVSPLPRSAWGGGEKRTSQLLKNPFLDPQYTSLPRQQGILQPRAHQSGQEK